MMKHVLAVLTLLSQSSFAVSFVRGDVDSCIRRYAGALKIYDSQDQRRICENYKDENLDCAVDVVQRYSVRDYRAAIKLCIIQYSEAGIRSCTFNKMDSAKSQGQSIDIASMMSDCRNPRRDDYREATRPTYTPAPTPVPAPAPVPQSRYRQSEPYYEVSGTLLGKIKRSDIANQIGAWLNVQPYAVRGIDAESYFGAVNGMLESLAVHLGREVRLYKVNFIAGGKSVECTGTDFSPSEGSGLRYFTLHECSLNGQYGALSQVFGNLNYGFLNNNISDAFRERMKQAERNWTGDGNINFRKDVSDYLVIGY